jgi:hypothetical protein
MTDERHLREMLEDALGRVKRELEAQEQLTAQYKAKCESLKAWKESAIEVEREWDAQAIATMLGGRLGDSCRRVVAEKVPQLIARVESAEAALAERERECERLRGVMIVIEEASANCSCEHELECAAYRFSHTMARPECVKNHPEWAAQLDAARAVLAAADEVKHG